jgi:hypothetical protein
MRPGTAVRPSRSIVRVQRDVGNRVVPTSANRSPTMRTDSTTVLFVSSV